MIAVRSFFIILFIVLCLAMRLVVRLIIRLIMRLIMRLVMCIHIIFSIWFLWIFFYLIHFDLECVLIKSKFLKKKFFFQNFMWRLILHAKITAKHEIKIYKKNNCDQNFITDFDQNWFFWIWWFMKKRRIFVDFCIKLIELNSIFKNWWFMKNAEFSSISVSNWFDDFFRSIHFDVLTLMIFVLIKGFKISQKFFLIITSIELFFSFIHLILIISRFS